MARNALISISRYNTITSRQFPAQWGAAYEPSAKATRNEAPSISRPSTVHSTKLGRAVHLMSLPERHAALLALYHPELFDLHEQHALSPVPAAHPLANHPRANGMFLLPIEGTVAVASRLGILSRHPVIYVENALSNEGLLDMRVPFPYLGDLLLFLDDGKGPYCVNWTVKKNLESFRRSSIAVISQPGRAARAEQRAHERHLLEATYFEDAGIRTQRVSEECIDPYVYSNLSKLVTWTYRQPSLSSDAFAALTQFYVGLVGRVDTVLTHLAPLQRRFSCTQHDCLTVLYQGIWSRKIRVDLFKPIFPNKALRRESSDVLNVYSAWFRR